jgi:hypothetical protein
MEFGCIGILPIIFESPGGVRSKLHTLRKPGRLGQKRHKGHRTTQLRRRAARSGSVRVWVYRLQKSAVGGIDMPTAIGRFTIWSIVALIAIVTIALILVNR